MRTIIFFFSFATMLWWGGRSVFIEETILYPSNGNGAPRFGISVAISSDGSRALVGAVGDDTVGSDAGAAYVFDVNPSNSSDWNLQTILYPSVVIGSPEFGFSVAISSDGTRVLIGATRDDTEGQDAGAAYVFDMNPNNPNDWILQSMLYPSIGNVVPLFGASVALSSDGLRAVIGAHLDDVRGNNAGAAYVFGVKMSNASDWMEKTILYPANSGAELGISVALSSDGTRALIGAYGFRPGSSSYLGGAYVFEENPSNTSDWRLQATLYPSIASVDARFGRSVALSSDGTSALLGANTDGTVGNAAGAMAVYGENSSNASDWTERTISYPSIGIGGVTIGQLQFGFSVALSSDGTRALIGAPYDDTVGPNAGSTYVFGVNPSNASDWRQHTILYPRKGSEQTRFGYSVAISSEGIRALVGAEGDSTQGTNAGATYVFDTGCPSGFILIDDGTACEQCPAGTISNADGLECEQCQDGFIANSSTCEECPAGQIPNEDQSECQLCPIGFEPNGKQTKCVDGDDGGSNDVSLIAGLSVTFILICCLLLLCCLVIVAIISIILGVVGGGVTIGGGIQYGTNRKRKLYEGDELFTMRKTVQSSAILADQHFLIDYADLEIENPPIGQGAFGVVNLGHYKGTRVAIKTLIENAAENDCEEFLGEVDHLTKLHHPNVVLFIGACEVPKAIITEFVPRGSLFDIIHRDPGLLNWKRIRKILKCTAKGMAYLHSQTPPMIHRDVKSGNILIGKNFEAKVCDFGISRREEADTTMTMRAGTMRWTAPEVLSGDGRYTTAADVYSYGIMVWEVLERKIPFADEKWYTKIEDKVVAGERPELREEWSEEVRDFINHCWAQDAEDRPTFESIVTMVKSLPSRWDEFDHSLPEPLPDKT